MRTVRAFLIRLGGLFHKRRRDRELDEEIESNLQHHIEDNLRAGMSPEEARRGALLKFGGIESAKEAYRDRRGLPMLEALAQDLRYGLRMLRTQKSFTFVAALTLALGIGANSAIFSVVNAVLLRSLPYRDPDQLVLVRHYRASGEPRATNGADFLEYRDQAKTFEQISAYSTDIADFTGSGEPERLNDARVSADLFAMLGVAPALGRTFTRAEDTSGGPSAVILSDGLWRRLFSADPQVIGRSITLGGQSRTIVGVMPAGFRFPGESDLWQPLALNVAKELGRQGNVLLSVLARLRPGVTPESARTDLSVILERQRQAFPNRYSGVQVKVIGLSESLVGNVRLALLVLFGAVAFVLLIACANVANLLLARSVSRRKELAIRAAMGAGRLRLLQQLLTEGLLLSAIGGAAGLLAANWGIKLLVATSPPGIPRIEGGPSFLVNGSVLGFTCMVVVLVALIAGILPALQASKVDINETLKAQPGARSERGGARRSLSALMITELALALVLLVGAGLMVKSFLRLLAVPRGFSPDGLLTLPLNPSFTKYPSESPQRAAYFQESLERVQRLPSVQSASLASSLPLAGPTLRATGIQIEGRPRVEPGNAPTIDLSFISSDYFQTMEMQIRDGRPFTSQDGPEAPRVVIINETLARRFFPNESPIGHRLVGMPPRTIVGVVGDTCNRGLDREASPEIFAPRAQNPAIVSNLVVRAAPAQNNPTGLSSLAAAIRNQMRAIDPNEPVNQVVTMDERLSNSLAWRRFQTLLLCVFAAVALVIAAVGIYGVISYSVNQRSYEIGIRMALGAQASDVLQMVIWRGMRLTFVGVALGLAAAFTLTRVMQNLLFEVSVTDPVTFALIALLLVTVALIASYLPARRATKVDPLDALRLE